MKIISHNVSQHIHVHVFLGLKCDGENTPIMKFCPIKFSPYFLPVPCQTVKQMWPYICQFVEKLFRETIEPAVKESNAHLSTFCFSKIDIGDKVSVTQSSGVVLRLITLCCSSDTTGL